jgi:hypothetical protein
MKPKTVITCAVLIIIASLPLIFISPNITGHFTVIDVAPKGFEAKVTEASEQQAVQGIKNIEQHISDMQAQDLNTKLSEDALREAQASFKSKEYTHVLELAQLVSFIKQETTDFPDKIGLLEQAEDNLEGRGVDTTEGNDLLQQARLAFTQEQFDDARSLLARAADVLETSRIEFERRKTIAFLSKNILLRYWVPILISVVVISLLVRPAARRIRRKQLQKRFDGLRTELTQTQALIKKLQKQCFIDQKMTTTTYKRKAAAYEERVAEIKHTIPVIQAELKGKVKIKVKKGVIKIK